jgi:hypothetical protein
MLVSFSFNSLAQDVATYLPLKLSIHFKDVPNLDSLYIINKKVFDRIFENLISFDKGADSCSNIKKYSLPDIDNIIIDKGKSINKQFIINKKD